MENKNSKKIFISCIIIALILDITIKGKVIFGLGMSLFIISYLIIFSLTFKNKLKTTINISWFLGFIIVLQALSFTFFYNKIILAIYFIFLPTLLMIQNLIFVGENKFKWSSLDFFIEIFYTFYLRILSHFPDIFKFIKNSNLKKFKKANQNIVKIIIGLIISFPILTILILLLSSADVIFSDILKNFFSNIHFNLGSFFLRFFIFAMTSILIFGFFKAIYFNETFPKYKKTEFKLKLDPIILSTIIALVNFLYILFIIIQFKYLFSGNNIPQEYNHADYARRGFFELVTISSINLIILSLSYIINKILNLKLKILYKILQSLLIINTFVLLYSAFVRMNKYEAEYGYTILRIFTQVIMLFLSVLLLIYFIKIFLSKLDLIKSFIITVLIFYSSISYLNIDKYIAQKNIELYDKTGKIDIKYLTSLSDTVIPVIINLENLPNDDYNRYDKSSQDIFENYIKEKKKAYSNMDKNFFKFNYTKTKIAKVLEK